MSSDNKNNEINAIIEKIEAELKLYDRGQARVSAKIAIVILDELHKKYAPKDMIKGIYTHMMYGSYNISMSNADHKYILPNGDFKFARASTNVSNYNLSIKDDTLHIEDQSNQSLRSSEKLDLQHNDHLLCRYCHTVSIVIKKL